MVERLYRHARAFRIFDGTSEIHRGVIATRQLAKRQWTWLRRRAQAPPVAWQVVLPRCRLDVHDDPERRLTELDREMPEVHRPVEDFYAALTRNHAALDKVFGADAPWPPDGFFERRRARAEQNDQQHHGIALVRGAARHRHCDLGERRFDRSGLKGAGGKLGKVEHGEASLQSSDQLL